MVNILWLLLGLGHLAIASEPAMEKKYLAERDRAVKKLAAMKGPRDQADAASLKALEVILRAAIGPIQVAGFSGPAEINLETLQKEAGFGQVDGLRYRSPKETLLVSSATFLKDNYGQAKSDEFYSRVFDWDSAYTTFAEIPLASAPPLTNLRASLMLNAQDIGLYLPNALVVFAVNGSHVYIVRRELKDEVTQIPACKGEWDSYHQKSLAAASAYRASSLKEKKSLDASFKLDAEAFAAYRLCFEKKVRDEKMFSGLKSVAQSIVERLQQAK